MQSISNPIRLACAAALGVAFSTAALAEEPNYTYAQVGYVTIDQEEPFDSLDAFTIGGSLAVTEQVHLFADYLDGESDFDAGFLRGSVDVTQWNVGAGLNLRLNNGFDFVGRLAYIGVEAEAAGFGVDGNGYGLSAGLRTIRGAWDLEGALQYVDIEDEDDTTLELAARYEFTPNFWVGPTASLGDDVGFGVSLRYTFE